MATRAGVRCPQDGCGDSREGAGADGTLEKKGGGGSRVGGNGSGGEWVWAGATACDLALMCGAAIQASMEAHRATYRRTSRRAAVAASLRRGRWSQQLHHSSLTSPSPLRSHMAPRPERVAYNKAAPAKSGRDDGPLCDPRLPAASAWPSTRAPP